MTMDEYLAEIRPAVEHLLPEVWAEQVALESLTAEVQRLYSAMKSNYERSAAIAESDVPDDDGIATLIYWDTYFGEDKEHHQKSGELMQLKERVAAKDFAVAALAAAVLQYAKQGLSVVHGGLSNSPSGRPIGSQALSHVVWQARNQALHWEEGTFSNPVERCFTTLAAEYGRQFQDFRTRNLAREVLELLAWESWDEFAADLASLG